MLHCFLTIFHDNGSMLLGFQNPAVNRTILAETIVSKLPK